MNSNTNHFELRGISPVNLQLCSPARICLHSARRFGTPPLDYGPTSTGYKGFIPISGGKITGPKLQGPILAHTGGD